LVRAVNLRSTPVDYGLCSPALRGYYDGYFYGARDARLARLGRQALLFAPDAATPLFAVPR
jgi:hypothetical protein